MTLLTDTLNIIFKRDLLKLKEELNLYNHEENLWRVEGNISNAAGNLCLHLIGNLNYLYRRRAGAYGICAEQA